MAYYRKVQNGVLVGQCERALDHISYKGRLYHKSLAENKRNEKSQWHLQKKVAT